MAIKVTYSDGRVVPYDNRTWWQVTDGGVLNLGAVTGIPDVIISPSAWANIDVER